MFVTHQKAWPACQGSVCLPQQLFKSKQGNRAVLWAALVLIASVHSAGRCGDADTGQVASSREQELHGKGVIYSVKNAALVSNWKLLVARSHLQAWNPLESSGRKPRSSRSFLTT